VSAAAAALTPLRKTGAFVAMSLDAFMALPRRPFAWHELAIQTWFVARVSMLPGVMLVIPFCGLIVFQAGFLLTAIGAQDLSGALASAAVVTNVGPIVSVLVVGGASATAMCADLGSRTIREELDAMRVLGIDPIQRLVVPRMIAAMVVAFLLNAMLSIIGLACCYFFSVYVQHVTPGAWAAGLTLVVGLTDVVVSVVKAMLFGLAAGLIACYQGMSVGGGAQGVGNAVNETIVYTFMVLFVINVVVSAVGVKVSPA
jgi:phospholipid/cholesterol/gamma-HCH transport system permease protein